MVNTNLRKLSCVLILALVIGSFAGCGIASIQPKKLY